MNRATAPSTLRVPSGNTMSERAPPTSRAIFFTMPAPGFLRSTSRWPVRCRCQPRNGKLPERGLGDDAQLERQRREDDRDVVDALMVRRRRRSCAADRAARGRATVTRTPVVFRISHAQARAQRWPKSPRRSTSDDSERDRAEDDRVDADGGNQEEDRPPPVKRRNHFAFCWARSAAPSTRRRRRRSAGRRRRPARAPAARPALRCSGRRSSCRPSSAARW